MEKRKESSLPVFDIKFNKHVYGCQFKHMLKPLKDFDPRPAEYQGTVPQLLQKFLKQVQGKGLDISLLIDKIYEYGRQPVTSPINKLQVQILMMQLLCPRDLNKLNKLKHSRRP